MRLKEVVAQQERLHLPIMVRVCCGEDGFQQGQEAFDTLCILKGGVLSTWSMKNVGTVVFTTFLNQVPPTFRSWDTIRFVVLGSFSSATTVTDASGFCSCWRMNRERVYYMPLRFGGELPLTSGVRTVR